MMTQHPLSTIQLQRMLRACIYAALLCAFLGVVSDARAQTKTQVCSVLDMSTAECNLIDSVFNFPSGVPWTISNIAIEGASSLRSTAIRDLSPQSCLSMNITLPNRTLVQFSRRLSSQPADELVFFVNGVRQEYNLNPAGTTGSETWSREVHILPAPEGRKLLAWCYFKNDGSRTESDHALFDDLSVIAPPDAPLNREVACLVLDMSLEDCELITSQASEPPDPS